jgi:chemotaxis protein MotB
LVSYADFITLLLAFFVTMYAITRLDSERLALAQLSIQRALHAPVFLGGFPVTSGIDEVAAAGIKGDLAGAVLQDRLPAQIQEVAHLVQESLRQERDAQDIRLVLTARGLVIHLPEFLFFPSGDAAIRPEGQALVGTLAAILGRIPNHVAVEGHTDDRPIHTPHFPSNWELSAQRAINLVRHFIEQYGLEPTRFVAAGYGEYAPVADNRQEEGRRLNRRVDIIIKPLAGSRQR